ncbi:hypothetical protein [Iodidimonas sp. SYSU 1G8]|uniref:hypothetical protein n=1 Tax=Iodidimonas sp. SYSU 1G8 TaxID=3133967 RepID=UPI0031FE6D6A
MNVLRNAALMATLMLGVHVPGAMAQDDLAHALDCWGVTHGSYFLHLASPETAGDLPKASDADYRAWSNQAETLAKAKGMSLGAFSAERQKYQVSLISAKKRAAATPRLKTCIATAPLDMLNVETPILVGD